MSYKIVELKAQKLLRQMGTTKAPVDPNAIAKLIELDILYEDLDDDVSGFLIVDPTKTVAVINSNHHVNRQRFTIAHEIGHYCLHVKDKSIENLFIDKKFIIHHRNRDSSAGTIRKEREANLFAAALLMPRSLIAKSIENMGVDFFDEVDMSLLARQFGVSEQALGFRLARLDFEVGE